MTPAVLAFGLHGTLLALIPLWLAAGLLAVELGAAARVRAGAASAGRNGATDSGGRTMGPFARLASVVGLRSAVFFGLQAFIPVYFAHELGDERGGRQRGAERDAGRGRGRDVRRRPAGRPGRAARDRRRLDGRARARCWSRSCSSGRWPATLLLVGVGFVVIANFSVTVVMGQEYLPNRLGLASGITLGAAIGVGGARGGGAGGAGGRDEPDDHAVDDRGAAAAGAADRADAAADRDRPADALAAQPQGGVGCPHVPWVAYFGNPIRPEMLLYDTQHSLVEQSRSDRLAGGNPNADGLGLGWYGGRDEPGLYRSVRPAWGDRNLRELPPDRVAAVPRPHPRRDRTPVEETNCHPFRHGRWLFMHNGFIDGYLGCAASCCSRSIPSCSRASRARPTPS